MTLSTQGLQFRSFAEAEAWAEKQGLIELWGSYGVYVVNKRICYSPPEVARKRKCPDCGKARLLPRRRFCEACSAARRLKNNSLKRAVNQKLDS